MHFLEKLANFTKQAAQRQTLYLTFALFGAINYLLASVYKVDANHNSNNAAFKLIALLLCFIHLLKKHWLQRFKKYLLLSWYLTITILTSLVTTSMPLKDYLSLGWLMNFNLGAIVVMLFVSGSSITS